MITADGAASRIGSEARSRAFRVIGRRDLGPDAYVLRITRQELEFTPGHHVHLGLEGSLDLREYSIYSAPDDDFLEVLVREIKDGLVSRQLRDLEPGDPIRLEGPYGYFTIPDPASDSPLLFVATGTGIAPFHCFARAYFSLEFTLLHGIRTDVDQFEYSDFPADRIVSCLSRQRIDGTTRGGSDVDVVGRSPWVEASSASGDDESVGSANGGVGTHRGIRVYGGRVTDYLREHPVETGTKCYLCGNCDMIYEAFDILAGQGVPSADLYAEVYF